MNRNKTTMVLMVVGAIAIAASAMAFFLVPDDQSTSKASDQEEDLSSGTDSIAVQDGILRDLSGMVIREGDFLNDTDRDGLSNVVENFAYGSDPTAWSTNGEGIPDGWLAQYGYDPTLPGHAFRMAAIPDPGSLPDAYGGNWPYDLTVKQIYQWGRPDTWDEPLDGPWENHVDPRNASDEESGMPFSWLHHYGFRPDELTQQLADRRLTDDSFSVYENFLHNTDPNAADTDQDGLLDSTEINQYGTDPNLFSTSGSGIPDGWLVTHGFKASDPAVGHILLRGKGMTLQEVWQFNLETFGLESALTGTGLDPNTISTAGHGIPDGWLVAHGLDPLDLDLAERIMQEASDFDHHRNMTSAPDGKAILPDLALTVRGHYEFGRPETWDEVTDGVWRNNLDPSTDDSDGDGIPDAIEIRGWYIPVTTDTGPNAESEWRFVVSRPTMNDTDGDGLSDSEEYFGRALHDDRLVVFNPTDPQSRDTAFSGVSDEHKVIGINLWVDADPDLIDSQPIPHLPDGQSPPTVALRPMLDPGRRDTSGSFLADGAEIEYWTQYAQSIGGQYLFPASECQDWESWAINLPPIQSGAASINDLGTLFSPTGDVDGDGEPNLVDNDVDGDGLLNGWEIRPDLYRFSEFSTSRTRPITDPANPDTDCEGLGDGWETKHARVVDGQWNLDPSRFDTDNDGLPDNKENLDDDKVVWFSYSESGTPTRNTFEYNNELEQARGTDPNRDDEDRDGVTEGWGHFWGREYPEIVSSDQAGAITPSQEDIEALRSQLDALRGIGAVVKDKGPDEGSIVYRRIVEVPEGTESTFLEAGEMWSKTARLDEENPAIVEVFENGIAKQVRLGVIEGTHEHTHAQDQQHGLNPYLGDTDGDNMPDEWEAYYGVCAGISPSEQDALNTPSNDGLTNLEIYLDGFGPASHWMHPCLEDTDFDGVEDAIEADVSGMDPTNPFDASFASDQGDQDDDGITDIDELDQGTHPAFNDTDMDGSLDGDHTPLLATESPEAAALVAAWKSIGIAHTQDDDTVTFYGEEGTTDPVDSRSTKYDVPDGWLVRHVPGYSSSSISVEAMNAAYECNKPEWWDETSMGVWWWGAWPNGGKPCTLDMDRDGLLDGSGEDPIPAASPNVTHRGHPLDTFQDASNGRYVVQQSAQTWGDCPGNPFPCQDLWNSRPDPTTLQAPVNLTVDDYPDEIAKNVTFSVTGNVCTFKQQDAVCKGVPNRTVVVQMDDEDSRMRTLGVGFTGPNGDFNAESCICATRSVFVDEAGMVVHSRSESGLHEWALPTEEFTIGEGHHLIVRVYATSSTMGESNSDHPLFINETLEDGGIHYYATGRNATAPSPVVLTSDVDVALQVPKTIDWSENRKVRATATLTDATGDPVPEELPVSLDITKNGFTTIHPGTTDGNGQAVFNVNVPGDGNITVQAVFAGTDNLSASQSQSHDAQLQAPLELELDTEPVPGTPIASGEEDVVAQATVTSRGAPVAGIPVRFALGSTETTAVTNDQGIAEATMPTDALGAGTSPLSAETTPNNEWAGASDTKDILVVSGSVLDANVPATSTRGDVIHIAGHLKRTDGSGLEGRSVQVYVEGQELMETVTGPNGAFATDVELPDNLGPGLWSVLVQYDGELAIGASSHESDIRILVLTSIHLPTPSTSRSEPLSFAGTLQDATGNRLRGERVSVQIDGEPVGQYITDKNGEFKVGWRAPDDIEYGVHALTANYGGSPNGTYGASQAEAELWILTTTTVRLEPIAVLERNANVIRGNLTTAEGDPLPGAAVGLEVQDQDIIEVVSDENGRFSHTFDVPSNIKPGPVRIEASFVGDRTYGESRTEEGTLFEIQPTIRPLIPTEIGRGSTDTFNLMLLDDLGRPIHGLTATLEAFNDTTTTVTGDDGVTSFEVTVPATTELGIQSVSFSVNETLGYLPSTLTSDVLVKEQSQILVLDGPKPIRPGGSTHVSVKLVNGQGDPIPDQVLSMRFEGDSVVTIVQTDSNGVARATIPVPPQASGELLVHFDGDPVHGPSGATMTGHALDSSGPLVQGSSRLPWIPIMIGLMGTIALATGIVAWNRIRAHPEVLASLKRAQRSIAAGDDWADAIREAYGQLVETTSAHGHGEYEHESVREFMQSLVSRAPVPAGAAVELTTLFEKATYAQGTGTNKDAEAAAISLARIVDALEQFLRPRKHRRNEG